MMRVLLFLSFINDAFVLFISICVITFLLKQCRAIICVCLRVFK